MHFLQLPELVALVVLFLDGVSAQKNLQGNDCTAAGAYTICQNLWGADTGVGSQTTTLNSANENSVSWETSYTWSNSPNNVKSYPNVYHNTAKGMQLQDIASAPTSWQWKYQSASNDLRADVSYDIWFGVPQTGDVASSASSYEIMIWLSARGGVSGIGGVVAQNIRVGGHTWNLHHGPNANWDVFSFITAEGDLTDFNADLNDFFKYLITEQGVAQTQYVQAVQTGTEPFTGSADLVISNFSIDVTTKENTAPTSTAATHSYQTSFSSKSSSASGNSPTAQSSSSSSPGETASSTDGNVPVEQTSEPAPTQRGTRNAGGAQCRLQAPSSSTTLRREERRSWLRGVFRR